MRSVAAPGETAVAPDEPGLIPCPETKHAGLRIWIGCGSGGRIFAELGGGLRSFGEPGMGAGIGRGVFGIGEGLESESGLV